jgi:hypothetical protein
VRQSPLSSLTRLARIEVMRSSIIRLTSDSSSWTVFRIVFR